MSKHDLESLDPALARLLAPARTIPEVTPRRRQRIRARLEAELGDLDVRPIAARSERRTLWIGPVAAIVAIAAMALAWVLTGSGVDAAGGLTVTDARITVRTGTRATVVAEPGSSLAWEIANDEAMVVQERGQAFYRVEPGGPYIVRTPAADIRVVGTSFEVEVIVNKDKLKWMSFGAGVAAVAVVTVYEGRVVLANAHGTSVVEAGQQASAEADGPPRSPRSRIADARAAAVNEAPATPETVLVADLRAKVRELETELDRRDGAAASGGAEPGDESEASESARFVAELYHPSSDELREAVATCKLAFAAPVRADGGTYLTEEKAGELGLTRREQTELAHALDEAQEDWVLALRSMYLEATGDEVGAASLSPDAMQAEFADKAMVNEDRDARLRIIQERAGLLPPQAAEQDSPAEQYYRRQLARTQQAYEAVARIVGEDRADGVLASVPTTMTSHDGCDDDE